MPIAEFQVDRKSNELTILVDTRFYGYMTVMYAAKAFTESCSVYVDGNTNDKLIVAIRPNPEAGIDIDTLGYEFYNCMLDIMQAASSKL